MKIFILILALAMSTAACGSNNNAAIGDAINVPKIPDFAESDEANVKLDGVYKINLIEFDSDPFDDVAFPTTITRILDDAYGSTGGEGWFVPAKIKYASIGFYNGKTFSISYVFEDSEGKVLEIGGFSEGYQRGTYSVIGNNVSFKLDVTSNKPGLLDSSDSVYIVQVEDGMLLLVVNNTAISKSFFRQIQGSLR